MKFRFFGDSWFWTWWLDQETSNGETWLKSQQVRSLRSVNVTHDSKQAPEPLTDNAISFIDIYLNKLFGHDVETFNSPGESFVTAVTTIEKTPADPNAVNVLFYSEPMRGSDLKAMMNENPKWTYDQLEEKIYEVTIEHLCKLGTFANRTNQKFIISGGQSTLYHSVFNKVPEQLRKNLTLLHPCILSSLIAGYNKDDNQTILGPFKFTECIGSKLADPVEWEGLDPSIPHEIFKQITDCHELTAMRTWPDTAHMNPGACLFFIDDLLYYLEGK